MDDVLDRFRPLLLLGNPDGPLPLVLVNSTWKTCWTLLIYSVNFFFVY
jgi:hypothetical protein